MFDFDIGKMMVVGIVALAVIPPKDLPRVMRTVGQVVGRMRRMAAEFQGQFMDAMREADLESVRKELEALNDKAKIESYDPAALARADVTKAIEAHEIGTPTPAAASVDPQPALTSPVSAAPPSPEAAALEDVRKELEALREPSPGVEASPVSMEPHPELSHEPPVAKSSAAE